jgi:uncharacterized membrane protein YgdD (TMEM256/DUF423 family)
MQGRNWITLGSLMAGIAVASGAFGAHVLEGRTGITPERLAQFETGARYQMYHAIGVILSGFVMSRLRPRGTLAKGSAWCFLAGIILFSGSLYLLVLTDQKFWGMIVPVGGVSFLAGWGLLSCAAWSAEGPIDERPRV